MKQKTTKSNKPGADNLESLELLGPDWMRRMQSELEASVCAGDEDLGHLEERLMKRTHELQRIVLEEAAQKKAEGTAIQCPACGGKLTRCSGGHARSFQSRFGEITIVRVRGWCRRCRKWRTPADAALGLEESAGYSPAVQEMAALRVSKMPVAEASALLARLTGVSLPVATLDREARRQGQRAERERERLDAQMQSAGGIEQQVRELQLELPLEPFTLVIEMDAWNVRERDQWGRTRALRKKGEEPTRWHWVYGGTCFRLSQRVESAGGRAMILSRGTVMTRGGIDALRTQIFAEAQRHGLGQAAEVLIVADGAVWIWNLAEDRFRGARQRLDYYHASEHLWAVARALHGKDEAAAREWVEPLLKKLRKGRALPVIENLRGVLKRLRGRVRAEVEKQTNYLAGHQQAGRMDYAGGKARGEPIGSGAMESTCRQYQCRFKRPGQFWSREGDEALMCRETFWRNERWHRLFPHAATFQPSRN